MPPSGCRSTTDELLEDSGPGQPRPIIMVRNERARSSINSRKQPRGAVVPPRGLPPPRTKVNIAKLFERCARRRTGHGREPCPGLAEAIVRGIAILLTTAAIYSGAHDAARAQTPVPNVVTPAPLPSTSRHFNYHQSHDVLQFSGGELSNRLFHSRAAHGHARRNCDLEPTANTACVMGCTSSQLACQTTCANASPSQ